MSDTQNNYSLDNFLSQSLKDLSRFSLPKKGSDSIKIDYSLNSYGYRCNEFQNQEILILGCSYTEGHGLPLELTWPYLISKKMNKDYINLAKGGDGAQAQVVKAFKFFEEFYNPKYIFAVFPMARMEVPLLALKTRNTFDFNGIGKAMLDNRLLTKISKTPHLVENILPEEFAVFYNVLFIKMLTQYCKANGIKLIWTSYQDTNLDLSSLKKFNNEYFNNDYLDCLVIEKKCHIEFSKNIFFDYAADYNYWPPGHWGFHKQIHIAESIYDML